MKSKFVKSLLLLILTGIVLYLPTALATEITEPDAEMTEPSQENLAPVAENLELTTYQSVGLAGTLMAVDPEGDFIDFQLVKSPRKGEVELGENGSFTYTPEENKRGKDSFTYVAVDAVGNISQEATVTIRIEKQSSKITYSDMDGHESQFAALTMAEQDIFIGEQIGGSYFFNPDATVTRGEFLAMCMKLADTELLTGISRTGFTDDEEIADWLKPYISTALVDGIIQGYQTGDGSLIFNADAEITMSEAAVLLNNVLGLTDVPTSGNIMDDITAPVWAYQATVNLSTCNIVSFDSPDAYESILTRSGAAEMLVNAGDLLDGRTGDSSLLSWAA